MIQFVAIFEIYWKIAKKGSRSLSEEEGRLKTLAEQKAKGRARKRSSVKGVRWILSALEEQDGDLIQVEVNEVLGLYTLLT